MSRKLLRIISVLVVLTLFVSTVFTAFATSGEIDRTPVIVVPGIMQSQVYVQDESGTADQLTVDGFPIVEGMDFEFMFDTKQIERDVKSNLLLPTIKSLLTFNRKYFIDEVLNITNESLKYHYFNPDGTRRYEVKVDEYWYSLQEARNHPEKSYNYAKGYDKDEDGNSLPSKKYRTEYDFIMSQVNLTSFAQKVGYDRVYYFAYSSFGDTLEIGKKFADYIQMVKEQTGSDKVNLAFISLGGTIGNVYLAKYCNPDDINRIVFAAAAIDGSALLGDIMRGALTLNNKEDLYNDVLPSMFNFLGKKDLWKAYYGNVLLRFLPNRIFSKLLNDLGERLLDEVGGNIVYNCPSMWALLPSEYYEEMSAKLLSDPARAELKKKTDEYYEIQKNATETIKQYVDDGMDIFVVSGYNLELPGLIDSYSLSSDNIIHSASTSLGAHFAPAGKELPRDYVPVIDESYISPDRNVDAGAGALPDRTWFVRNQSHLTLQGAVEDTIELCVQILTDKNITDARVNNGGYPQFQAYRNLTPIKTYMREINEVRRTSTDVVPEETKEYLLSLNNRAYALIKSRIWDEKECKDLESEMQKTLFELGKISDDPAEKEKNDKKTNNARLVSELITKLFGSRDFYFFTK